MFYLFGMCLGCVTLTYCALRALQYADGEAEGIGKYSMITQGCLCIICSEVICFLVQPQLKLISISAEIVAYVVLLSVLGACLLIACIMDMESYMVYNYVWCVGVPVTVLLMGWEREKMLGELALFLLLQELFFCRVYGRADCHAFCVCAMAEAALGMKMQAYLMHMLLAFGLLAVVQGIRCNIGRDGNLKKPVAFLPYIVISFWGIILGGATFGR